MSEYHKINSPWKRHMEGPNRGKFIEGQWSQPEIKYLKDNIWTWDEKVDGTNMRVEYSPEVTELASSPNSIPAKLEIKGRSDNSQIRQPVLDRMNELFTIEKIGNVFPDLKTHLTIYGEGYGQKIQKVGSLYLPDSVDFILFDVKIGKWWLEREAVEKIGEQLGVKVTPMVGEGTLAEATEFVSKGFKSKLGDLDAEGLILRPQTPLMARNGSRIITKLKTKDFR